MLYQQRGTKKSVGKRGSLRCLDIRLIWHSSDKNVWDGSRVYFLRVSK